MFGGSAAGYCWLWQVRLLCAPIDSFTWEKRVLDPLWELAIVSNQNNEDFHYYSDHWTDGAPFNTDDKTDTKNAMFAAYNTTFVQSIRLQLDGTKGGTCSACFFEFDLPDAYWGKYTLRQLVTLDGGVRMCTFVGAARN